MDKLELRAVKCCLFGCPSGVKGFKLWDPIHPKCVINHDLIFRENKMYYLSNIDSKGEDIDTKKEKLSFEVKLENKQVASEFQT